MYFRNQPGETSNNILIPPNFAFWHAINWDAIFLGRQSLCLGYNMIFSGYKKWFLTFSEVKRVLSIAKLFLTFWKVKSGKVGVQLSATQKAAAAAAVKAAAQ